MPARCVASNCSNEPSEHVSLHKFPKNEDLKQEWIRQVQRTRAGWPGPTGLSGSAALCSRHFLSECFDHIPALKESLGFAQHRCRQRMLLPTAVPTIFKTPTNSSSSPEPITRQISTASLKLQQIQRVDAEALQGHAHDAESSPVNNHQIYGDRQVKLVDKRSKIVKADDGVEDGGQLDTHWFTKASSEPPNHCFLPPKEVKPYGLADSSSFLSVRRHSQSSAAATEATPGNEQEASPGFCTAKVCDTKEAVSPNSQHWFHINESSGQEVEHLVVKSEDTGFEAEFVSAVQNPEVAPCQTGSGETSTDTECSDSHESFSNLNRQMENTTPINLAPIVMLTPMKTPRQKRVTKRRAAVKSAKKEQPNPKGRQSLPVPMILVQNIVNSSGTGQSSAMKNAPRKDKPDSSKCEGTSSIKDAHKVIKAMLSTAPYSAEPSHRQHYSPVLKALNSRLSATMPGFNPGMHNLPGKYGSGKLYPMASEGYSSQSMKSYPMASSKHKPVLSGSVGGVAYSVKDSNSKSHCMKDEQARVSTGQCCREGDTILYEDTRVGVKTEEHIDIGHGVTQERDLPGECDTVGRKSHETTSTIDGEVLPNEYQRTVIGNESGVLGWQQQTMAIGDEGMHLHNTNSSVYLDDITSKVKCGRKRRAANVDNYEDIEWALFSSKSPEAVPTRKRTASTRKKLGKKCRVVNNFNEIKVKIEKESRYEYSDHEFDIDTFFDTSSEDEAIRIEKNKKKVTKKRSKKDDPDWKPEPVVVREKSKPEPKYEPSNEDAVVSEECKYFECDKCDAKFGVWFDMMAHQRLEHHTSEDDQNKCVICDAACMDNEALSLHMSSIHSMGSFPDRKLGYYFCPDCKHQIPTTLSYIFHREERHECVVLTCALCRYNVEHRFQMKMHMERVHGEPDFAQYSQNVEARSSSYQPKRAVKYSPFFCPMCGERFETLGAGIRHRKWKHAETFQHHIFQCHLCQKVFTALSHLRHHYLTHNPSLQCAFCTKRFHYHCNLRTHVELAHCGIKQDSYCAECDRILATGLKRHHARVHNNVRAYLCDTCGRGFKTSHALAIHNHIHDREKPVACAHCDYRCRQKTALNWHMKRAHQGAQLPTSVTLPGRPRGKARTKKNSNIKVEKAVTEQGDMTPWRATNKGDTLSGDSDCW